MNKVAEALLTQPTARNKDAIKTIAYKESQFTPWAGDGVDAS